MDRIFFSKNNFNVLYNIIGEKIYKRYNFDIANNSKYETEILNIMRSVYQQRNVYNIPENISPQKYSNELSKRVLGISINYLGSNLQKPQPIVRTQQKQNTRVNKNRLDNRPQPSFKKETNDINKMYEHMQNMRNNELDKGPDTSVNFQDETDEPSVDVNSKFEEMARIRRQEFEENQNNDPNNNAWAKDIKNTDRDLSSTRLQDLNVVENTSNKIPNQTIDEDIKKEMLVNTQDSLPGFNDIENVSSLDSQFGLLSDNKNTMAELSNKFESTSVQDRLKQFERDRNIDMTIEPKKEASQNSVNVSQEQHPKNLYTQELSMDNNTKSGDTLENFYKLETTKSEHLKSPEVYDEKTYNLIINSIDRDWFSEQNALRYKYTVNFGILENNLGGIGTQRTFRNVTSVKLKRLILPNYDEYCDEIYAGFKTEPYLLLHIDELNSNVITTNRVNKSIFCKPHFDKEYCCKDEGDLTRGFTYYCNNDCDITEFYPTPKSELNKLSIELMRSNGKLYSETMDNVCVNKLEVDNVNKKIILTLDNLNTNIFKKGDKILGKELGNFITDEELKCLIDEGLYVIDFDGTTLELKIPSNSETISQDILEKGVNDVTDFLKIINCNLQHSIILEIKTREVSSKNTIQTMNI